jgi:8-oxo-dGTP pyrophosphatase MutT (NUDIX family)
MYKIYFGEKYLLITDKGINNSGKVISYTTIPSIIEFVIEFDESIDTKSLVIIAQDPSLVFNEICHSYTYIEAAGGLVKNNCEELLLIYRYNKWDLPKGKVEKDELLSQCALREVEEECGISGHEIVKQLVSTIHTYHDKGSLCFKQTYWYEMKYSGDGICTPQLEENITKAQWVTFENLPHFYANSYHSVIDIIESLFD